MVKEARLKPSTAAGKQAAREAERAAERAAREARRSHQNEPNGARAQETEFDRKFELLGLGKASAVAGRLCKEMLPSAEGLTPDMVNKALRAIETEKTNLTGKPTTQLDALNVAREEWSVAGDDLYNQHLAGFVRDNIRKANPEVKLGVTSSDFNVRAPARAFGRVESPSGSRREVVSELDWLPSLNLGSTDDALNKLDFYYDELTRPEVRKALAMIPNTATKMTVYVGGGRLQNPLQNPTQLHFLQQIAREQPDNTLDWLMRIVDDNIRELRRPRR